MIEKAQFESAVAAIWKDVLGVNEVRELDNFLDLGGSSLRAGEIVFRIRQELDVDVTIDTVLDEDSFQSFVNVIRPR